MVSDALHFFISVAEVSVAVASILIAGLMVGKVAFWIVSRILGKFAGPPDIDDSEDEPTPPDDAAISTHDGC